METIRLTMGQALMKFLDNQYIEFDGIETKFIKGIFTILGHGNVVGFGEALEAYKGDIVMYQGRNEQGMAHVAIGYAKQKNRKEIIACTSSIGPGALNMVTAAGTATANRIPLLLFPGDTFACRQPDPVLQQMEQTNSAATTVNDAFKPVSKYWDRVSRPEQLMSAMINAMRVLTDPGDTGAVTICLPQDVEGEAYDYPIEFFERRVHHILRRIPTRGEIERAIKLISSKKKPMMICGGGVLYSEAGKELKEFANKFNIPFAETQAGKSALVWDEKMNLGGMGVTGGLAANKIADEADLIIAVGTRLTDFTTSSKWLFKNPNVKFLNINVSSFDGYKINGDMIIADAKETLLALEEALEKVNYKSSYINEIAETKENWNKEVDRLFADERENGLSQTRVLGELDKFIDDDSVIVGAAGSLPGDLQRVWRPKSYNSYHLEYGFSCMGYEIAAAMGVKLAEPHREVYSMVGDGSFMMLHSELVTSIQEGVKVNVVLFDNVANGCINNLQMGHGIPSFNTEFNFRNSETGRLDGAPIPIDFAMVAAGYGVKTFKVSTVEELREALAESKKSEVSTLIDIKVLHRTMTGDYAAWWRVGVPEVSESESVRADYEKFRKDVAEVKQF
ncbi:3D-(3,5/4)-trihydroxycyclohexane-1,2-dione acylhydrolase (decyclizing) [Clostridium sp.]|uniref:3D-(3,5/4)-trihydroxycyclohexane-1,2-dione acylhydrolase (decyclizing) n=1 Tax=Clostridium sp. TaxID=1506 RepID=UPI00321697A6